MITKHAKKRMTQRFAVTRKKSQSDLFNMALQKGYNLNYYRDSDFKKYLQKLDRKQKYTQVKIYDGKAFIHRNKSLITAFNIPLKYGNTDSYLVYGKILEKLTKRVGKKYHTDQFKFREISKYFRESNPDIYVVSFYVKDKIVSYGVGNCINLAKIDALNNVLGEENKIIVK